jgi:hypothetical protein
MKLTLLSSVWFASKRKKFRYNKPRCTVPTLTLNESYVHAELKVELRPAQRKITLSSRHFTLRLRCGHDQVNVRSRSSQGAVTIKSRCDHVKSRFCHVYFKVLSCSAEHTITLSPRQNYAQLNLRSRLAQTKLGHAQLTFSWKSYALLKVRKRLSQVRVKPSSENDHVYFKVLHAQIKVGYATF